MKRVKKTLAMLAGIAFLEGCVEQPTYRPDNNYTPLPAATPARDEKPVNFFQGRYDEKSCIPQKYKFICDIYPVKRS